MKRRSLVSPAPTARHGNGQSTYQKYNKHPARYSLGKTPSDSNGTLHSMFYRSVDQDAKGHPHRVATGVIKRRIADERKAIV